MVELSRRGYFDEEGVFHKCGLPIEKVDPSMVHVHVCGLPFMELPLDRPGTCRHNWFERESKARADRGRRGPAVDASAGRTPT